MTAVNGVSGVTKSLGRSLLLEPIDVDNFNSFVIDLS